MDELEFYNGQRSGEEIDELAVQSDLASIHATGSTNATGDTITAGTYFYLNGVLVRAKTNIASGATFTSGTNYVRIYVGGLNRAVNGITNGSGWYGFVGYDQNGGVVQLIISQDNNRMYITAGGTGKYYTLTPYT